VWAEPEVEDDLLDELAAAFASADLEPCEPTVAELAALQRAVAGRFGPCAHGQVVPLPSRRPRRARRVGFVTAGIIACSASAAAATGGVPLPDPVRAAAYAVGLPVDSPALHQTHRHLRALEDAIEDGDRRRMLTIADDLRAALTEVPEEERDEAEDQVDGALDAVASLLVESNQAEAETAGAAADVLDPMPAPAGRAEVPQPAPAMPDFVPASDETEATVIDETDRESAVTESPQATDAAAEPQDDAFPDEMAEPEAFGSPHSESAVQSDPSVQEGPASSDDGPPLAPPAGEASAPDGGDGAQAS
jgi:hypothetical protein